MTENRPAGMPTGSAHVDALVATLSGCAAELSQTTHRWGRELADRLCRGHRLLVAGNGGSAAQAQHLTSELVGRYRDDRPPLSALALHAESSSFTAITNDYGVQLVFARQVRAHGRPGDVLLVLTTSGRSPNCLAAVEAALDGGLTTWALTGPAPNPIRELVEEAVSVEAESTATVQEVHQVVVHLLCAAVDVELGVAPSRRVTQVTAR